MDDDGLGRLLPGVARDAFRTRRTVLAPWSSRPNDPASWRDAVVVVERGMLELEDDDGVRHRFPAGSVVWLSGPPVRRLHNPHGSPVVLAAVARRPDADSETTAMTDQDSYRQHSPFTDPAEHAGWLGDLPRDIATLRRIANGLVFHYRAHGDVTDHGFDRSRLSEIDLRYADRQLARLRELADRPIDAPRAPTERLLGCCRDTATLFVSLARQAGLPARSRVGFAGYLVAGWYLDHVIAEVWDEDEQRWRRVEPDVGDGHVDPTDGEPLDVLDVAPDRFLVAASAWRAARSGRLDAERFVVAPDVPLPFLRGYAYLAHNLVFDLAALNGYELLLWDSWGMLRDGSAPDELRAARLDQLAERLDDPALTRDELRELLDADDVRVPEVVVTEAPPVATKTSLRTSLRTS